MTTPTYDPKISGALLVGPYNDFLKAGYRQTGGVHVVARADAACLSKRSVQLCR
jgi:hypothetical protein